MGLTTRWKAEGIEIGRARRCQLVLRQWRQRLGSLDAEWEARINPFSFDQLGELGEALVDSTSTQDLKSRLAAH